MMVRLLIGILLASASFGSFVGAAQDLVVYTDSLQNGWENWSWAQTASSANPVHGGAGSLAVTTDAWEAAYFHHGSADATLYTNLTFWLHGGASGGQRLLVQGISGGAARTSVEIPTLAANSWREVIVSLAQLGVANDPGFDGFWIQDRSGGTQPTFYLDDIRLVAGSGTPAPTNSIAAVGVDAAKNRRAISDLIYGVAFASSNQLKALNVSLNRSGGNSETRYNWQLNAHNRAFDWYFQSLPDESSAAGAEADEFVAASRNGGAEPMLTVPMIGWVAKLGPSRGRLSSFSIAKYGPQTGRDAQWFPDAGNGISAANNQPITNNDPNDANLAKDSTFQQEFVRHLTNRWGTSAKGGLRYYVMDNEPSLWHSTHRDVVKTGLRMTELRDRHLDYAAKVRAVDPGAIIVGPEEWGWSGYIYSGYDQQWGDQNGWSNLPDRAANGGMDYLPWFLDQMRRQEQQTGQRLLDVFTVHYYPQGGEYSDNVASAMQLRRNRSTRSLWDPNYRDESWINDRVRLVPRLKEWVNQYYPGLRIGITEYSWGADGHISGALAQADILGIFGREGLDMANRWVVPATDSPTFKAFQMYRNYDGSKSTFGETSVAAEVVNPDNLSAFGAVRASDGALTVMVVNKVSAATPVSIALTNFSHRGTANVWQLTSANTITRHGDVTFGGSNFTNSVPGQSVTMFVIPANRAQAAQPRITRVARQSSGSLLIELAGTENATYRIEKTSDFSEWVNVQTLTLSSGSAEAVLAASGSKEFFRAVAP